MRKWKPAGDRWKEGWNSQIVGLWDDPALALAGRQGWRMAACLRGALGFAILPRLPNDKNQDVRWRQRFQSFRKAFGQLSKAAHLAQQRGLSDLEQLGLIHRFEFTHELAYKTLKDFLKACSSAALYGPRDATREAFAAGLIEDRRTWMAMIESRQMVYNDCGETVHRIAGMILSSYLTRFERFEQRFAELEREEIAG